MTLFCFFLFLSFFGLKLRNLAGNSKKHPMPLKNTQLEEYGTVFCGINVPRLEPGVFASAKRRNRPLSLLAGSQKLCVVVFLDPQCHGLQDQSPTL